MHPNPNPLHPKQLKSDKLNTLLLHLERQLAEEQLKEDYHQRVLSDIKSYSASLTQSQSMVLNQQRVKTESADMMSESKVSISMESQKKSSGKKVQVDFEMEYQQYSKEINKLIDSLCQREGGVIKKSLLVTPKKNSSMMRPVRTSRTSEIKLDSSMVMKGKTDRQWKELSEQEKIMMDFGDTLMISSTDDVVLNLVRNVKAEEEKYVAAVLTNGELSIRQKMKNYMQRQSQKNEQTLFKLQQEAMDQQLVKLQANKEVIRDGYTTLMKQLVQQGLRQAHSN